MRASLRRQAILLSAALVALGVGLGLAALVGGGDERAAAPVPPGGSRFGGARAPATTATAAAAAAKKAAPVRLPLPLDRAVAQLFVVGFAGTDATTPLVASLRRRDWGGVLVERGNYVSPDQLRALVDTFDATAREAKHTAPLVAAAQPGGRLSAFADLAPTVAQVDLASATPKRVFAQARAAAKALRAAGVDLDLAPEADVAQAAGPAAFRAFSDEPAVVTRLAVAAARALRLGRVASAVGHFPGQGAASQDPLAGPATVGLDLKALRARDLRPFVALRTIAPAVVMSNASYVAFDGVTPAALEPAAYRLLRQTGFRGVAMTDDLTAAQTATGQAIGDTAVDAFRAGADLLLVPGDAREQEAAYRRVLAAVRRGTLPRARVAQAVGRVLALKRRYRVRFA